MAPSRANRTPERRKPATALQVEGIGAVSA